MIFQIPEIASFVPAWHINFGAAIITLLHA